MNSLTIILLSTALSLFIWLAATQSKKIRSFQFQLSVFIIIWIVGDLFDILQNNGVILVSSGPSNTAKGKEFDSGLSGPTALTTTGKTFSYKFTAAGTFPYFCQVHPTMVGTVGLKAELV
jgi:hypothetical protein